MTGQWRPGGKSNHEVGGDTVASVLRGALGVREAWQAAGLAPEQRGAWARAFRRTALRAFDDGLRLALRSPAWQDDGFGATEFQGPLAELSVMDLVQAIALGRRDGVIAVAHDGAESRLWCAAGEIVDAESGPLVGEPAVYRVLSIERGHVSAELCRVQRERSIQRPTPALLLEAARRKDELELLRTRVSGRRFVSARTAHGDTDPTRAALLRLLQSPRGLPELLAACGIGEYELLAALVASIERREVVSADDDGAAASALSMRPAPQGPASTPRGAGRRKLTVALAVGALTALGAGVLAGRAPPPPGALASNGRALREAAVAQHDPIPGVAMAAESHARPVAPESTSAALRGAGTAVLDARAERPSLVVASGPAAAAASAAAPATARPPSAGHPRRDGLQSLEAHATRASPSTAERPTEHLMPRMRIIEERIPYMQIVE